MASTFALTCIHCGCTDTNACVTEHGPCSWVSEEPPICSACVGDADVEFDAAGPAGEADAFCPASPVATPHQILWHDQYRGQCVRCHEVFVERQSSSSASCSAVPIRPSSSERSPRG